jgi:predicted dinucleotide-binding enzyme
VVTPLPLTVAVLGAGIVGRTLAEGWARAGHRVLLGSRRPDSARVVEAVAQTGATSAADHTDALRLADVSVVTVPGDQVDDLLAVLGEAVRGRVLVDATNALATGTSTLHHVDAFTAAGATVYRAFNSTGWEQMARPLFGNQRADMPYAGPDSADRAGVDRLIDDLGFRAVWLGDDAEAVDLTDALARLSFRLAFAQGWGRRLGWRLLTESDAGAAVRP